MAAKLAKKLMGGAGRQTFSFFLNKKVLGAALLPKKVWRRRYANGEYFVAALVENTSNAKID